MKKLDILKSATGLIVSAGAGAVVGNAIKASTPADIKTIQKVLVGVGGFVLSGMAGEMASKYVNATIDETAENLSDAMKTKTEES